MEKIIYPILPSTADVPNFGETRYGYSEMQPTGIPMHAAEAKKEEKALTDEEIDAGLAKPVGYKLLLALPDVEDKFEGTSIVKARTTLEAEQITTVVALVIDMGDLAYDDKARFPKGPWCKVGDYVLIRPYQGTRFMFNNREYRIVSDDGIEGVVPDPRNYRRA